MIRRWPVAALAALAFAPAAGAQTVTPATVTTGDLPVTGAVPELCALGDPALDPGVPTLNVSSLAGRVLQIATLTDPTTLTTRAARAGITVPAMCNYPYVLTVESRNNGLWRELVSADVPAGFGTAVPYIADIAWDTKTARLQADALGRSPKVAGFSGDGAADGSLVIDLTILPGATNTLTSAPLLAGLYQDTLTITVAPR